MPPFDLISTLDQVDTSPESIAPNEEELKRKKKRRKNKKKKKKEVIREEKPIVQTEEQL